MVFVKLFSSITESSLWSEPKDTRLLFVTLLAKADAAGFVEASLPGLARVANLTIEETMTALKGLEGPDLHSKNPDHEGRRLVKMDGGWLVLNYQIYRERRNDEDRQAYMREYMRAYRSDSVNKRKQMLTQVNNSKPRLAQVEAEVEVEVEVEAKKRAPKTGPDDDPLFCEFWDAYGKKVDQDDAFKVWRKLSVDDREAAADGAPGYAAARPEAKYRRSPARYLRERSWRDEAETPSHQLDSSPGPSAEGLAELRALTARDRAEGKIK